MKTSQQTLRYIGAIWGVVGTMALLAYAVWRLGGYAWELTDETLTVFEWAILVLWSVYMFYAEGVKAFGRSFSPRVVARAQYIAKRGNLKQILLAPLFCFGYFHTSRKRLIVTYSVTLGIVLLIVMIRFLPQPWRGILDAGAELGIAYGTLTIFYFVWKALVSHPVEIVDPMVATGANMATSQVEV
jgi:hypothetical protein